MAISEAATPVAAPPEVPPADVAAMAATDYGSPSTHIEPLLDVQRWAKDGGGTERIHAEDGFRCLIVEFPRTAAISGQIFYDSRQVFLKIGVDVLTVHAVSTGGATAPAAGRTDDGRRVFQREVYMSWYAPVPDLPFAIVFLVPSGVGGVSGLWRQSRRFPMRVERAGTPRGTRFTTTSTQFRGRRTSELRLMCTDRLDREIAHLATVDPLTGALNRRSLENLAERESAAATRHGHSLILLMLDLDHFKKINDEYGHAAGDEALRAVTATLRSRTRHEDVLSRIGGEEFVILLTHTDLEMGVGTAQRLRAAVEAIALSVSIGLAK